MIVLAPLRGTPKMCLGEISNRCLYMCSKELVNQYSSMQKEHDDVAGGHFGCLPSANGFVMRK